MDIELERRLLASIETILAHQSLTVEEALLQRIASKLQLNPFTLSSALLYVDDELLAACCLSKCKDEQNLFAGSNLDHQPDATYSSDLETDGDLKLQLAEQLITVLKMSDIPPEKNKMVRYRIEVGSNHQVTNEQIKSVLISESGVDRAKIGYMDIRANYTLVDLPPGMPPDIFQLLQVVEINQQPLLIKRVSNTRKRPWQRRKQVSRS